MSSQWVKVKGRCLSTLDDLVETLYTAAASSLGWDEFLQAVVRASDSRSARMLILNADADQVTSSIQWQIDPGYHQRYVDYYVNACPWRPELRQKPPGRLYSTYTDFSCPQPDYYRTEFFNDWAGPQDIHHGACGTFYRDGDQTLQLLVQRTRRQGPYLAQDMRLLNDLIPHLQRAVLIQRQIVACEGLHRSVSAAARLAPLPFVLFNEQGRVVHLEPTAEALIDNDPRLQLHQARLTLTVPCQGPHLSHLIRQAIRAALGHTWSAAGGLLRLDAQGKQPLNLLVAPLPPEARPFHLCPYPAHAALFLHDPAQTRQVDQGLLAELHGLTEAEARVAAELVTGASPGQVAELLGVTDHTVRTQLKSVFRKMRVSRQADLVRAVLTGPAYRCALGLPGFSLVPRH
ncbi:helix-turn-helix transcriptional regulator [Alkalilimnicola ehrlichii MLHE-1]|uniref:Transcriptional regulator, LuxR family n=1 Tax=Alkalilimnicola ehrlichii (strain ATCC BAA-1101 / DSM 17681 / MLHE-1) TaxID=187272 RepID=Q0A5Z2_ALKEH|nr:helix-turn-helix transcriptional regulator [Alkalilimnicola ehrlichii]ABI57745.1 transcriptional regulator, LuxR family [Alkalilimnicola ehrlichii MLHE-1]